MTAPYNRDEPHEHNFKWEKLYTKYYMLYGSTYTTFKKKQNWSLIVEVIIEITFGEDGGSSD